MTTRFFPGSQDPDADHLNDLLDAMRSGVPVAGGDEASGLAATAREFRTLDERARIAAGMVATTFDSIWEDMMSGHGTTAPTPFVGAAPGRSTEINQRVHPVPPQAKISRMQSFLSAAIVAIMIAGLVSAAWNLRGGGGDKPDESARLAATALDGTPEASPDPDAFWLDYVVRDPRYCTGDSTPVSYVTTKEQAELIAVDRVWPDREYTPLETVPDDIARDVTLAARNWEAGCGELTDRLYWEQSSSYAPSYEEQAAQASAASDVLSAAYPIQDPTAFVFLTDKKPDFGIGRSRSYFIMTPVFAPDQAVQLTDGRIAIPESLLIWKGDPKAPIKPDGTIEMADYYESRMIVLAQKDGTWKVDEFVDFCVGNCTEIIGRPMFAEPLPPSTPEVSEDSSEASPAAFSDDWWTWPTQEECVPEDFPDRDPRNAEPEGDDWNWAVSQFIPFAPPSPQDAEAAASVARQIEACKQAGVPFSPLESDRYYAGVALQDPNYMPNYIRASRAISEAYPVTDPEAFVRTTSDEPVFATPSAVMRRTGLVRDPLPFVYIPDQAVELADGRIGIPAGVLLSEGSPDSDARLQAVESGLYVGHLLIFTNQGGDWLYDGELALCIGECGAYWEFQESQFPERATPESTKTELRPLPGTPFASPETPPIADVNWTAWVTPEECAVEPMTAEEYAEIMRQEPEESTLSSRSYTAVGAPEPAVAEAVARTARAHETCSVFRMTEQKRALESPAYIYISNAGATSYQNADERIPLDAQHGEELSAQLTVQDPTHYIAVTTSEEPPADRFLGNVFNPETALLLEDGRVAIPGTKLFGSEPEDPFYPGAISILTDESGEWLLDEMVPFCVGDCDEYWAQMDGGRVVYDGTPAATPIATPEG